MTWHLSSCLFCTSLPPEGDAGNDQDLKLEKCFALAIQVGFNNSVDVNISYPA